MIPRTEKPSEGPGLARLAVIDDVELQAPADCGERLRSFYADLIGLPPRPAEAEDTVLRFKSERHEMRITLVEDPAIESVDMRVTIEVPSMEDTAARLEEQHFEVQWIHGIQSTDVAITVLDPAGNRVLLRRQWGQF